MKRLLLMAVFLLTVLVMAPALMAADKWSDYYNKGVAATQAGDWATVADQMQKSIALKPVEDQSARVRNDLIVYVPHFWLGIARVNLNDPDAGLTELQLSQSQGVVQNTRYFSELRKWISQAQQARQRKLSDLSADSRKMAEAALNKALGGQVDAMAAGADRSDSFRAAVKQLQGAMDQYNKAGTDSNAYRQSAQAFAQVSDAFAAAERESKARKARPAAAVAQQTVLEQPKPVVPPTVPVTQTVQQQSSEQASVPSAAPMPNKQLKAALSNASGTVRSLRNQINEARGVYRSDRDFQTYASTALRQVASIEEKIGRVTDLSALQKVMQDLSNQSRTLGEKTSSLKAVANMPQQQVVAANVSANIGRNRETVRAQLHNAYSEFTKGNVETCESITSTLIQSRMANEDAFLLRGVARFTRAMVSNQRDLLGAAAADFSAALTLNSAVGLDPKLFSPKLVSFFNDVRKKTLVR
ncbi:MAG TPA: hypothetical protein VHL58_06185 [Thermoanaerobaculia bacterium]|nr:hypothetical protein [Thermoanaerobaculia bacterium]